MYHLYCPAPALLAALTLACVAPAAAAAAPAVEPRAAAISGLPDPVLFRVRMEIGALGQAHAWLDAGLDPDFMGDRIGSGLMIAAWEGNVALMELFATRGADIDKANVRGETALMHAAWKGHLAAVQWLLGHGARIEREPLQWTALHYAIFAGHAEIAELLLNRGADINARSPNGSSVLMMAVYEGRDDLVRRLLARGADAGVKNENGHGAIEWAMKFNHTKIARMVAGSPEAFRVAASQPKADWGTARKSEPIPKEIEQLMAVREILAARNLALDKIDRNIAAQRAKHARAALKREAPPPAALEISASRKAPGKQAARIVYEKKSR